MYFCVASSVDKLCIQALKGLRKLDAASFDAHVVDTFTTRLSDGSEVELKPDGRKIAVTPDNVDEFVELVMRARLAEGSPQVCPSVGCGTALCWNV